MFKKTRTTLLTLILLTFTLFLITCNDDEKEKIIETFLNPPEISSSDGVLSTTFTLEFADGNIMEGELLLDMFNSRMINGTYTPPVLRIKQGDVLDVTIQNNIDQMYQNHTHGMNVTPISPGDDIFIGKFKGESCTKYTV